MEPCSSARREPELILIHLCSGGFSHMMRLLSNSIDYSIKTKRLLLPISVKNPAFTLPFYHAFTPQDDSGFIASLERYTELSESTMTHSVLGPIDLSKLSLGFKGVPDYSKAEPKNKSMYILKIDGRTFDYPLGLGSDGDFHHIQITSGDFSQTNRYKRSYSACQKFSLSKKFSEYIKNRSRLFYPQCIAAHYRNSDDKSEPYDAIRTRIEVAVMESGHTDLFVATDNLKSLDRIREDFPHLNIISHTPLLDLSQSGSRNLHYIRETQLVNTLGITKADQIGFALADLWCLSQAEIFIPSNSEFSTLAAYFRKNPNISKQFFKM